MKPYQKIPIIECGEPLIPIPLEKFSVVSPHPYQILGADYGHVSPYYLRENVLNLLLQAQKHLQSIYTDWKIQIFDAYRPLQVQKFMVDYSYNELLEKNGLLNQKLTPEQNQEIWEQVYQFWAIPNYDLATPPPHSTGAAIDITLVDSTGKTIDIGGEIDEISERSHPNYYSSNNGQIEQEYHQNRQLLYNIMKQVGFTQHPNEWWHFSTGDQMWAWLSHQPHAKYGRIDVKLV
jgi:zinc D-Ala-D-Ala dipeptidase